MTVPTGSETRVNYLWEDNGYAAAPNDSDHKVFGANTVLDTAEATNNGTRITLPASKIAVDIEEGTFDGAWAVSFQLTNPWWARAIFGEASTTDNNDGSYTHTWDLGEPDPLRIIEGYEVDTDDERVLKGCVAATFTIDPTVDTGEGIPCTIEGFYAKEDTDEDVGSLTAQTQLSEDSLDYGDTKLDLDGTKEAIVQNASLTMTWDPIEPVQAFDSRFAIDYLVGLFTPDIQYTKIKQDSESIKDVYGGSTSMQEDIENQKPLTMTINNGKAAGSGINKHEFSCSGTFAEAYDDAPAGDPTAPIEENLNRLIEDITFTATNETATAK